MSLDILQCNDSRLLHDIAQITRQCQFSGLAFRQRGLNKQDLAAYAGPGQSRNDTGIVVALIDVTIEGGLAQQVFNLGGRNLLVRQHAALSLLEGHLAQGLVDLLLQLAYTAFAGVLLNDFLDGSLVEVQLLVVQTRVLLLLRYQVPLGNLQFLLGDISADLNNFHAVE